MTEMMTGTATGPALEVTSGAIIAYHLYDIADAIDLAKAEKLWVAQAGRPGTRGHLSTTPAKAVAFGVPPLVLPQDPVSIEFGAGHVQANATARLYDFGVASLVLHIPIEQSNWAVFCHTANALGDRLRREQGKAIRSALIARLREVLAPALDRPSDATLEEDYLITLVRSFSEPVSAAALLQRVDILPLLTGEQRPLSEAARADLLQRQFSHYADDLVVLTWDRAFIYEPQGDSDVMDIIEVANAQLLEMRFYDELLDAELPRMYRAARTAPRGFELFGARRFARLARRFQTLVGEVTQLTEKVDNALQVTEDVYLARVYAAALDLFRVKLVHDAVERKLAIMRETYTALYEVASASRAELLEILIAILIALEITLTIVRH
jgi:hypothetical protein